MRASTKKLGTARILADELTELRAQLQWRKLIDSAQSYLLMLNEQTEPARNQLGAGNYFLGLAALNLGNLPLAKTSLLNAIRYFSSSSGSDSPQLSLALSKLGIFYAMQGRFSSAKAVMERAVTLQKSAEPEGDFRAELLLAQAKLYFEQELTKNSLKYAQEAIEICRGSGVTAPYLLSEAIIQCGISLARLGRDKEAEELIRQSFLSDKTKLAYNCILTATALRILSDVIAPNDTQVEGERLLLRAKRIFQANLGKESIDYFSVVRRLGCLKNRCKDWSRGAHFLREALRVGRVVFRDNPHFLSHCCKCLEKALQNLDRQVAIKRLRKEVDLIRQNQLVRTAQKDYHVLRWIVDEHMTKRLYEEALPLLSQVLALATKDNFEDTPQISLCFFRIANCHKHRSNLALQENFIRKGIACEETFLALDDYEFWNSLSLYADVQESLGYPSQKDVTTYRYPEFLEVKQKLPPAALERSPQSFEESIYSRGRAMAEDRLFYLVFLKFILAFLSHPQQLVDFRSKIVDQARLFDPELFVTGGEKLPAVLWCALTLVTEKYFAEKCKHQGWSTIEIEGIKERWYIFIGLAFVPGQHNRRIDASDLQLWKTDFLSLHQPSSPASPSNDRFHYELREIVRNHPKFFTRVIDWRCSEEREMAQPIDIAKTMAAMSLKFKENLLGLGTSEWDNVELPMSFFIYWLSWLPLSPQFLEKQHDFFNRVHFHLSSFAASVPEFSSSPASATSFVVGNPKSYFLQQRQLKALKSDPNKGICFPTCLAMVLKRFSQGSKAQSAKKFGQLAQKAIAEQKHTVEGLLLTIEKLNLYSQYIFNLDQLDEHLQRGHLVATLGKTRQKGYAERLLELETSPFMMRDFGHIILVVGKRGTNYLIHESSLKEGAIEISASELLNFNYYFADSNIAISDSPF